MLSCRYITELPSIPNYYRWGIMLRYLTLLLNHIMNPLLISSNSTWRCFSAISSGASFRWFQEVQVYHIKNLFASSDIILTYLPYSIQVYHIKNLFAQSDVYTDVPSLFNYRQLPCRTFISVGTCPYRERCVYLHDPRLMCRDAKTKSRRKNNEDLIQDSLFWYEG